MEAIESCYSERKVHVNLNTLDCVMHAEDTGIFAVNSQPNMAPSDLAIAYRGHSELVASSSDLESKWKSAYDIRRD